MAFLGRLFSRKAPEKPNLFLNITKDTDPKSQWSIISQLGEGTFGIVHKVRAAVYDSILFNCPWTVVTSDARYLIFTW